MFSYKHKLMMNYGLALLLFFTQFVSQVHATEHPFHENDVACAAFLSVENNKLLNCDHHRLSLMIAFVVNKEILSDNQTLFPVRHFYQQRAPPITLV
jgi:hypothetical protein